MSDGLVVPDRADGMGCFPARRTARGAGPQSRAEGRSWLDRALSPAAPRLAFAPSTAAAASRCPAAPARSSTTSPRAGPKPNI
jgi:hypothetical protein